MAVAPTFTFVVRGGAALDVRQTVVVDEATTLVRRLMACVIRLKRELHGKICTRIGRPWFWMRCEVLVIRDDPS